METLRPLGVPLDLAVFKLVDALKVLGSDHLIEAARFYRSHQSAATLPRKTVPEVFSELLANRRASGKSELYLKDLQLRLGRFADAFKGPITAVTTKDIDQFLLKLKVKGRTRFNFLRTIGLLFSFPQAQGYALVDPSTPERVAEAARSGRNRGMVQLCTTVDAWAEEARRHNLGRRCLQAILNEPGWTVRILGHRRRWRWHAAS